MPINVERNDQERKDGTGALRLTVFVRGDLKRWGLRIHVKAKCWDTVHKRVKIGEPMHAVFNRKIEAALTKARTLEIEHPEWTADQLVAAMDAPYAHGTKLHEAIAVVLKERASQFAENTLTALEFIRSSCEAAIPNASLEGLTSADVYKFRQYMADLGQAQNTLRNRMKYLRTLYWHACSHYKTPRLDVWDGAIPREVDVEERGLTLEEFDRFKAWAPPPKYILSKHAFLLAVYLGGMRVADVCRLKSARITEQGLSLRQGKSKAVVYAEISESAREIIGMYAGGEYVLPLITDDSNRAVALAKNRLNAGLKVFAREHGTDTRLSMHWARRCAADLLDAAGVDYRTIQLLLGHSTLQQTVDYMAKRSGKAAGKALKAIG